MADKFHKVGVGEKISFPADFFESVHEVYIVDTIAHQGFVEAADGVQEIMVEGYLTALISKGNIVFSDVGYDGVLAFGCENGLDPAAIALPREIVGIDQANDLARSQPQRHVFGMGQVEIHRLVGLIVFKDPGLGIWLHFALSPFLHAIGRIVIEDDEFEIGVIDILFDIGG